MRKIDYTDIAFHIPSDEIIPTSLRLRVWDEVDVIYERLSVPGRIAYQFDLFRAQLTSETEGREIIKKIANIMECQSYDHGAHWVVEKINALNSTWSVRYTVVFRMRDAG